VLPPLPRSQIFLAAILVAPLSTCVHAPKVSAPEGAVKTATAEVLRAENDPSSCPSGMVRAHGDYCPDVEHRCLRWLDPPGKYHAFRCAEYAKPAVCRAARRPMSFCIDRDEQRIARPSAAPDDRRPTNNVRYLDARAACEARGARLCTQSEWQFACEGEEMRPYPYGFSRDSSACNVDHFDLGRPGQGLKDRRTAIGANPRCTSVFGVRDLAGNLEEWVTRDPDRGGKATLLKGSWWLPGKSTCRATNAGHDEHYHGPETGFRCCK
jgi:formylglycine-generating enzyme required for sulfatase activity